jgi:integrase
LPEELKKLWSACEATEGDIGGIAARNWWHSLHAVCWDSGERISALLGLRWEHISLESGWANFPAEIRKGRRRDLSVKLHADTVMLLMRIRQSRGPIFPWPYFPTHIFRVYGRLLRSAGLPSSRKHKFHCMRKSVASYYEAAGGNATALLDHSDRKTTEAYLDPRIVGQQHASDILFRLNSTRAG